MPLVVMTCKGEYAANDITASAGDIDFVVALCEGVVSVYDEKSVGGTDCATPATMRQMKFGVSRIADKLGTTFTLKHVKAGKNEQEIFGHKAIFDANFESSATATGMRMVYGGER